MTFYVNCSAPHDGDGSKEHPFKRITAAAQLARAGDEVVVAPAFTGNALTLKTQAVRTRE